MRRFALAVAALCAVVVLVGAYAVLARKVLHGPVNGESLSRSVELRSNSAGPLLDDHGRCRSRGDREWMCSVMDSEGGGSADYAVRVRPGSSCWTGRLVRDGDEGGMTRSIRGCVHLWQWTALDFF